MASVSSTPDCDGQAVSTDNHQEAEEPVLVREPQEEGELEAPQPSLEDAGTRQSPPIPLLPPEDCIQITPDGRVLKKVLDPGEVGTKPTLHARCLVHYVGYLASSGDLFMDTRRDTETGEPIVVVAGRTAAAQETGLCLAAATMARGEKALVYVQDPSYGYGRMGSFSFPCVPPDSQLVYEVEMINWEGIEETDNDQNRGSLLFEERLERAERRRDAGNALYMEGKYKDALAKYALALSYMDEDFMYQLEGHYLDKAEAVKLRIHLNMAASQLNTGDYNTAIYNCGQVLNIEPHNVKALFRRGKARHALGRTEEALKDLEEALKIDSADKAIIAELHAVKATMKKEREAQAALFKGRLKAPASTNSDGAASPATPQPQSQPGTLSVSKAAPPAAGDPAEPEIRPAGPGLPGEGTGAKPGGSVSKRAGAGKAGSGSAKAQQAGEAGQERKRGAAGSLAGDGLARFVAWLWSLLVAALAGLALKVLPKKRSVRQRPHGRGR